MVDWLKWKCLREFFLLLKWNERVYTKQKRILQRWMNIVNRYWNAQRDTMQCKDKPKDKKYANQALVYLNMIWWCGEIWCDDIAKYGMKMWTNMIWGRRQICYEDVDKYVVSKYISQTWAGTTWRPLCLCLPTISPQSVSTVQCSANIAQSPWIPQIWHKLILAPGSCTQ